MINPRVLYYDYYFIPKVFNVLNNEHFSKALATMYHTLALQQQPLSSVKDLGKTLRQSFTKNSLCPKINFGAIQHGD